MRCGLLHTWLWLGALAALCSASMAQTGPSREPVFKTRTLSGHFPLKPSVAPAFTIPVDDLGFAAPSTGYLGQRSSMASLDFLGEDRLLFTFHVPGLQHREPGDNGISNERQIRAVVLSLPSGPALAQIQAQTQWTLHDRSRYLWMLKDGHFLIRDRDSLLEGDASLALKPILRFPGPLLTIDMDPDQRFMVTNSVEPPANQADPGTVPSPATASATVDSDNDSDAVPLNNVVRILDRASSQVMLVSRARAVVHLPINSEGYVESLRGSGVRWVLDMNFFTGGTRILGDMESSCMPQLRFVKEQQVLATSCRDDGSDSILGITTDGRTLWKDSFPDQTVWPIEVMAPNGLRIARESLYVSHAISSFAPLGTSDIQGQWVRIFDAATGDLVLEAPASPVLDGGGNMAISPSGKRVALLGGGGIQIFDLPAPPPLPQAHAITATP